MSPIAFKGLETDSRLFTSRVMSQNKIKFMFTTAMHPQREFDNFLSLHGDAVRKVSLLCKDVPGIHDKAMAKGATSVHKP
jgi:4-hydroxyphenylpyruvate dioxygenase